MKVKADLCDEYALKIEDMDILLEEVDIKEQERADMEAKLEEMLEYE